ncbi:DHA2 family efflux MFS transporter permease subunit [Brevibacillus porteri]|uniref:DHA2 family efflux MFS transporter permease subunit n=1 Tax=Brevibacillus porteri TaxID=2126350 RepID=UPI002E1A40B0|nr:DHA2 family efflux MFS transporter permease subunit [Brevibacillus porteri]MED2896489.1 DHA2 family efflux MFS transporter permease subunit [Brevibacillus porteri]
MYKLRPIQSNKWAVLSVVTLVSFITNLDATIVVIGLPAIMEDLRIPINIGMWTITAFYIMSTLFLLPAGRWSDMLGTKHIFLWGLTLFTISTALCGLANSSATLIGARLLQGTGAAMAMASATPILIRTFPPNQLGIALGINNISWVTGSLIGPVIGGALIDDFGWRSIFFVAVPTGVIGLISGLLVLKNTTPIEKGKTDWPGILTFGPGLVALLVALSEGQSWGWTSVPTLSLFATALLLWIAFVLIELRVRNPLFPLSLFTYRNYSIGLGITMSYCIGYFAVTILLMLYLQGAHRLSPLEAGLLLIPLSIPQLFTAPFGGKFADRFGPVRMILLGSFLIGLALLLLGQLGSQLSNMAVIIPLLIISAATGLSWPSLAKAVLSAAPQERAGSASGMFWTVYEMCRAISQALSLVVVQLSVKSSSVLPLFSETGTGEIAQSKSALIYATNNGFRFFAIFFAIAIVLGFFLMKPQSKKDSWKEKNIVRQSG